MLPGVDVSGFQGPPANWRGAAGQISWAAVKITELQPDGTRYVNPDADADWAFLGQQGKGRIGYLFGHPATSAGETAQFFAHTLRGLGLAQEDGIMLDLEVTDGLPPQHVDAWAVAVLQELRWRLSRMPLVYTFLDFAWSGNCSSLGSYPLWIADPSSPKGKPRVPAPWASWAIHQYGQAGIDRDVANYPDMPAMHAALGRAVTRQPSGRHQADGHTSLAERAKLQGATPAAVLALTGLREAGEFGPLQAAYVNAGDWSRPMPEGMVYYLP